MKRVLKIKTFDRWAHKRVSDELLCLAARDIEQGLFEADLGGGVCKKRVPLPGQGKVAQRARWWPRSIKKNAPGSDFSDREVDAAKLIASALAAADPEKINALVAALVLKEICHAT